MKLATLTELNAEAASQVRNFRGSASPERLGVIDENFHHHKNHFPYYGFVEIVIGEQEFIMFSANDDLVAMTFFWYGADSYEPMSMQLWRERAGSASSILDIGAFSGVYSLCAAAASPNSRIYAVEAARRTYGRLLVNTQINKLSHRIDCTNKAVSKGPGLETFMRFRGENILGIGDSFMPKHIEPQASEERVETIGLDAFCEAKAVEPDLIKIDVEGAELLALDGMIKTLETQKPSLLIEVTPKTAPEVVARLNRFGFEVHRVDERKRLLARCEDGKVPGVVNLLADPLGRA